MPNNKEKIVVAMSGGVDSSVSAALLVEEGYEVEGIMMRLWSEPGQINTSRDNRCCTRDQMIDAHLVAKKLGIPFEVVDIRATFKKAIVDRFIKGYSRGITPNPCLHCNRHIRFGWLLNEAKRRGARYLATGHYARITQDDKNRFELRKGRDPQKDQSYVLSVMTQEQLKHAKFPIGNYTKGEVREIADQLGLRVAGKGDSMDLCFVADGDYRRFLRDHTESGARPGKIVLRDGGKIGEHSGLFNYTIGQRKGLGISWHAPLYVLEKNAHTNTLVVGTLEELGKTKLIARKVNWIAGEVPETPFRASVKIRYKAQPKFATISPDEDSNFRADFDEPLRDITPGQGAVIYDGDKVVASGIIAKV